MPSGSAFWFRGSIRLIIKLSLGNGEVNERDVMEFEKSSEVKFSRDWGKGGERVLRWYQTVMGKATE